MDSFFYAILDSQDNLLLLRGHHFEEEINVFSELRDPIQRIFLEDKLLQLAYHKTKLAFINNNATLVPLRLYDPEQKKTYLQHLRALKDDDSIAVNMLSGIGANLVYAVSDPIYKMLLSYFPSGKFYHGFAPILMGYRRSMEHQHGSQIFLNVKENLLQLVLFDGNKLQFCNSFPFQTSKDFIYFVMLIFDQFKLKPESTAVHLSGLIERDSEIYKHLYRYIRHINFITQPSFVRFGEQFTGLKKYFYYDLFCLKLCE